MLNIGGKGLVFIVCLFVNEIACFIIFRRRKDTPVVNESLIFYHLTFNVIMFAHSRAADIVLDYHINKFINYRNHSYFIQIICE